MTVNRLKDHVARNTFLYERLHFEPWASNARCDGSQSFLRTPTAETWLRRLRLCLSCCRGKLQHMQHDEDRVEMMCESRRIIQSKAGAGEKVGCEQDALNGRICVHALAPLTALRLRPALESQRGQVRFVVKADRKSTRLNSSHLVISYAVFCLK